MSTQKNVFISHHHGDDDHVDKFQRMLGRGVEIVTSGAAVARQVEHALGSRGLASPRTGEGTYDFLCTGDPEAFRAQGTRFLQLPLGAVEQVRIPDREVAA